MAALWYSIPSPSSTEQDETTNFFSENPIDGLSALTKLGQRRAYAPGATLMRQGESGRSLHIILWGRVVVEREHDDFRGRVHLAELAPGEVVGEMGVIEGEARSATVTAIEQTETLEVEMGPQELTRTLLRYPEVLAALLKIASRRLRVQDDRAPMAA